MESIEKLLKEQQAKMRRVFRFQEEKSLQRLDKPKLPPDDAIIKDCKDLVIQTDR